VARGAGGEGSGSAKHQGTAIRGSLPIGRGNIPFTNSGGADGPPKLQRRVIEAGGEHAAASSDGEAGSKMSKNLATSPGGNARCGAGSVATAGAAHASPEVVGH